MAWCRHPRDPGGEADPERATLLVLNLSLSVGEILLSAGQGADDVESAMLAVLHGYRLTDCEPQVTFTMISVSRQLRGEVLPATVARTVRHRAPNYHQLTTVYRLIDQIAQGDLEIAAAHRSLGEIGAAPYPRWLLALAPGALAASASLMVSGRSDAKAWLTFAIAFIAAAVGARLAALLAGLGMPDFFQHLGAALPASAAGVGFALTGAGIGGSAVVTGALFALFPGRSLVGAVEDGLTGSYLTAAARLIEVLYLVAGIILGVLAVLPVGVRLGAEFVPEEGLERSPGSPLQLPAAAVLAVALALMMRTPRRVLPVAAFGGVLAWGVFHLLAVTAGINPVFATGAGAAAAASFGQLASHARRLAPLPYITGSLGPLLPGSLLYTGVLALGKGNIVHGVGDLSRAAATALALAVGVSLSTEAARLAHRRNQRTGIEDAMQGSPAIRAKTHR